MKVAVIGTGTLLESARLVRFIAELLEISDRLVHMTVLLRKRQLRPSVCFAK